MAKPAFHHCLNIGLIITLCCLAYLPGLTDFMLADDSPNITMNDSIKITQLDFNNLAFAATNHDSGPLGRPVSYLSFALNYYFSGQQIIPRHFKATNLGIHIANSILIYTLTLIFLNILSKHTRRYSANNHLTLALVISLLWALHPIQLTTILYSVQRMTSMASFFMLAGLIAYLQGRKRLEEDRTHALTLMFGGIILGTTLGALCKEIALLLPFYAVAIELTLHSNSGASKKKLKLFYLTIAVIPAIIGLSYLASHPQLALGGYIFRDFTIFERLLTEPRVLFYYSGLITYPNLGQLSLHHDDILISKDLLTPLTTIFALLGIALLLLLSLFFRKKQPIISFMILWFLVGHAMESTFFGLEIAYEHRNYLPSYSIIFGIVFFSYQFLQRITNKSLLKAIIAIATLSSMFFTTFTRATIWSDEATISYFDARNHPNSSRSQMTYAYYLLKTNKPLPQIYEHIRIAATLSTTEIESIIYLYKLIKIIEKDIDNYSTDHVENTTTPDNYAAPLVINNNYVRELAILIDNEINRRLQGDVATHRAAMALRELSYCIMRGTPMCTPLTQKAIDWLTITTKNPRHSPKSIAVTYYFLAKLKAYTGDTDAAFYYVDKALLSRPDDFSVLIGKINLYLTVEDLMNSEKLIRKLEKRNDMPENFKHELSHSKEYLRTLQNSPQTENPLPQ